MRRDSRALCACITLVVSVLAARWAWADATEWERLTTAGIAAYREHRVGDSEVAFKAALTEAEQGRAPRHVAISLENLGTLYRRTGRLPDAEGMHQRALGVAEAIQPADDALVETTLKSLAWLYHGTERYSDAYGYYERIMKMLRGRQGPRSPSAAAYLTVMAELRRLEGKTELAARLSREALDIVVPTLDAGDPNIATVLSELVWDLRLLDHAEEASAYSQKLRELLAVGGPRTVRLFQDILRSRETLFGTRHPSVAKALADMALVFEAQGRDADGEALCAQAIRLLEDGRPPASRSLLPVLVQYADLLRLSNQLTAARVVEARIEALKLRQR